MFCDDFEGRFDLIKKVYDVHKVKVSLESLYSFLSLSLLLF